MAENTPNATDSTCTDSGGDCVCNGWWQLPVLLTIVLAAILLFSQREQRELANGAKEAASREPGPVEAGVEAADRVSITIDYGDGQRPGTQSIPWQKGMTVRGMLASAALVSFGQIGRGESAFLVQINNVENEGAGGRNWMYSVNGTPGDRSFEVYELGPNDHVLWRFTPPQ